MRREAGRCAVRVLYTVKKKTKKILYRRSVFFTTVLTTTTTTTYYDVYHTMFGVIPTHRTYAYCSNAAISNGVYSMVGGAVMFVSTNTASNRGSPLSHGRVLRFLSFEIRVSDFLDVG